MATEDYQDFQDTFTDLVEEFGWSTAVITVETEGAYNPATGAAIVSSVDTTVNAALLDISAGTIGQTLQGGSLVVQTDKRVLLPFGTAPSLGDKMTFGSLKGTILGIKEINPGGTVLGYELIIRNG